MAQPSDSTSSTATKGREPGEGQAIHLSTPKRVSRDEMNLAEFPISVLSTRTDPSIKTLEFKDTVTTKSGREIKREWVITGADKFGLPTSTDDEVLLGLLKLSVDSRFESNKVYFTRYELLRILRWTTEGRSYTRLQNSLDRLSGVRIKATNAFFDNDTKSHSTKNFGIIDAYEINDGRDSVKPSFFIWSEEIFSSFQAGFIKKIDLEFFLNLKSSVSKRLYRYLDKHFWYRTSVRQNLFMLSHEKIGISRNYKYASSLKQQLDPALKELLDAGFISGHEYHGRGKNAEITLFAGRKKPRSQGEEVVEKRELSDEPKHEEKKSSISQKAGSDGATPEQLERLLAERGVSPLQCKRLVAGKTEKELSRISEIIKHFDSIVSDSTAFQPKNPAGFLFRAVEKPFEFVLPTDSVESEKDALNSKARNLSELLEKQAKKLEQDRRTDEERESAFHEEQKKKVGMLVENLDRNTLEELHQQVQRSLKKLRGMIAEEHYEKALEHAFTQKVAEHCGLPTFDQWKLHQSAA